MVSVLILGESVNTDYRIAVAFVAVVITGYFGDQYPKRRGLIISGWLTCSLTCAVIICAVYNFKARYGLLIIMAAGLWATNACALSYAASTFSDMPRETRGVALALVNALGNLAQIYGYVLRPKCSSERRTDLVHSAYLFPEEDRPKYLLGFGVIAGMCAFGVVVYALAHVLFRRYIR
jgi:MFS family permease